MKQTKVTACYTIPASDIFPKMHEIEPHARDALAKQLGEHIVLGEPVCFEFDPEEEAYT